MSPVVAWHGLLISLILVCNNMRVSGTEKCDESSHKGKFNMTKVLYQLLVEQGYDKRVRPNYGSTPVTVGITMFVTTISRLSEVDMDMTLDMYFRQYWQDDKRLNYSIGCNVPMTVGAEVINSIWTPDTFFANEKKAYFHEATSKNTFLRISPDGSALWSVRLTVTAMCNMDLKYFPMDKQKCTIEIESFGYTTEDITYIWANNASSVGMSDDIHLPQFNVIGHLQQARVISLSTGDYSRLSVQFQFVRNMGYYLIQIYIPASLIVVISWVSFWLSRDATPARVALGVTTVLTMTTLMSSTNASLPKISYVKSIDVYLGICFLMVFSSLLEYAAVGYLTKNLKSEQKRQKERRNRVERGVYGIPSRCNADARTYGEYGTNSSSLQRESNEVRVSMPEFVTYSGDHQPRQTSPEGQDHDRGRERHHVRDRGWECEREPLRGRSCERSARERSRERDTDRKASSGWAGTTPATAVTADSVQSANMNPSDIDKYSRVIFPLTFCCFQVMYWAIYLHVSEALSDDLTPS